jgi:hypothetical protein
VVRGFRDGNRKLDFKTAGIVGWVDVLRCLEVGRVRVHCLIGLSQKEGCLCGRWATVLGTEGTSEGFVFVSVVRGLGGVGPRV